ncbi:hypothetical protein [Candidatus Leptofilum sp.]|uniref:hypothetical protein n=1 Tax=Candidatus Leptofilum sp. TaxID=3241576 RepID=UPI003B5A9E22
MSELQAVTGQLYIVDGVMQTVTSGSPTPGILVQPPPSKAARSRSRDFLFVHLTLSGNVGETAVLTQDLLDLISQKFYATSGSLTAALRGAIMTANQTLLQRNLTSKETAREGGITCAVLRQDELFTLQAGETLALLGHNFGIERLPPRQLDHITPLGRTSGLDIRYAHHRLQSGDLMLLADPRLSHLPTDDFNEALVDTDIESGLDSLIDIVADESARLLMIEFNDDSLLDLPDVVVPRPREGQMVAPTPQPRRDPEIVAHPVTSGERLPQPVRESQTTLARDSARTLPIIDRQQVETTARRAGSQAALGLSTFTAWLVDLLSRLRPPRTADAPAEEEEPTSLTWPILIAIFIPVFIAVIVSGVYLERGRNQRLSEIQTEMSQFISLADQVGADSAQARQYYNEALALAVEAETEVRPGDGTVAQLRATARQRLDVLDDITRLSARPYYEFSEGTALTHVELRDGFNGGIFILDKGNGLVYEQETDESYLNPLTLEPEARLFNGQAVGSGVVGSVIDMFWRPAGSAVSRDGLAMLDSNGALLTYQPNLGSTFAVPLDLASQWQAPIAISTFDERLYILDIGARVIWKYFPSGDDFIANADDRTIFFDADPELNQVIDFDIFSQDGGLVLLYRDGRIRYYDTRSSRLEWDESDVLANGLLTPFVAPTSVEIVGRGLNASIFVADPGSGRIVQISRPTGQVLAQYRATAPDGSELFSQISDFAIAETPLRVFVTTEQTLYLAVQE